MNSPDRTSVPAEGISNPAAMLRSVYEYFADRAVQQFNRDGELQASLASVDFRPDGTFGHTAIEALVINQLIETEAGRREIGVFIAELIQEGTMRQSMRENNLPLCDAAVMVMNIWLHPNNPTLKQDAILIVIHTVDGIKRGICTIEPTGRRRAVVGPMLDEAPVADVIAPSVSREIGDVLATRRRHDIHHAPETPQ